MEHRLNKVDLELIRKVSESVRSGEVKETRKAELNKDLKNKNRKFPELKKRERIVVDAYKEEVITVEAVKVIEDKKHKY